MDTTETDTAAEAEAHRAHLNQVRVQFAQRLATCARQVDQLTTATTRREMRQIMDAAQALTSNYRKAANYLAELEGIGYTAATHRLNVLLGAMDRVGDVDKVLRTHLHTTP